MSICTKFARNSYKIKSWKFYLSIKSLFQNQMFRISVLLLFMRRLIILIQKLIPAYKSPKEIAQKLNLFENFKFSHEHLIISINQVEYFSRESNLIEWKIKPSGNALMLSPHHRPIITRRLSLLINLIRISVSLQTTHPLNVWVTISSFCIVSSSIPISMMSFDDGKPVRAKALQCDLLIDNKTIIIISNQYFDGVSYFMWKRKTFSL